MGCVSGKRIKRARKTMVLIIKINHELRKINNKLKKFRIK